MAVGDEWSILQLLFLIKFNCISLKFLFQDMCIVKEIYNSNNSLVDYWSGCTLAYDVVGVRNCYVNQTTVRNVCETYQHSTFDCAQPAGK